MPKYIDADEFVKIIREWYCEQCQKRKGMKRGKLQFVYEIGGAPCRACDVDDVISDIEDFPAADVEPVKHGYYIGTEFDGYADENPVYYEWKCSECDCVFEDDEPKYRYCPHCGAKMDKEADNA